MKIKYYCLAVSAMCMAAIVSGCASGGYSPMEAPSLPKQWFAGVSAGFSDNIAGGEFHSLTANPDCNGFTGGSAGGIAVGVEAEYLLKQDLHAASGIDLRLTYEQKPGTFTTVYGPVKFLNAATNQPEDVAENHIANVTYNVFNARLFYKYAVPHTMAGVELGPSIGFVTTLNVRQHLQIDQSIAPGATFYGGETDSTIYDASPSSKSGIRFGLWAGADYRFDAGEWVISPFLGYDFGLTKTLSTASWSVSSIIAGVDFKYGFK